MPATTPTTADTTDIGLTALGAALAASPQLQSFINRPEQAGYRKNGQILALIAAFLASPSGQALENAVMQMLLSMIAKV